MRFKRLTLWLLSMLLLVTTIPVYATNNVEQLEDTTSDLENELSNLNEELDSLNAELDSILSQIQQTSSALETTKNELAIAMGQEKAQYEAMTLRIKYLYENGNTSIMEMLFSAGSIAEFLNHAEYYSSIMEYDRAMLDELVAVREDIAAKEQKLTDTQKYLQTLQTSLDEKENALTEKISSTSADLSEYTAKLEAARNEIEKVEDEAKEEVVPIVPEPEPEPEPEQPAVSDEPVFEEPEDSTDDNSGDSLVDQSTDLELFAALLECEAGSRDYEAILAVASVVVNRMNSSYYPDTLRGVILQSGQFPPATNGKVERVLARGVKDLCVTAAQDALNGKNNVGDCLQFRAASSGHVGTVIGDNVFF